MPIAERAGGAATLAAEQRLLLRCAAATLCDADAARADLAQIIDWESLLEAADYHGLLPSLAQAVGAGGPAPPEVLARLRDSYRNGAMRALYFSDQLRNLAAALREGGVSTIALKGPALAESLYPDPALRPFSDLDLFVRSDDVAAAVTILARRGYALAPHFSRLPIERLVELTCEASLASPAGIQVDLHWAVAPCDYPFVIDPELLWRGRSVPPPGGPGCPAGLDPETLLLYLCVHGAKHRWCRLIWLADIAWLARNEPDWNRAWRLAVEAGGERPLLLGLLLARDLLAAPIAESLLERAMADEAILALSKRTARLILALPPVEPDALALTNFNARLANRLRDKLRCYAGLLRAPTEAELALLLLPKSLSLVYYPVRILRVGANLGIRLVGAGRSRWRRRGRS